MNLPFYCNKRRRKTRIGKGKMNGNRLTDEQIDGWWDIARIGRWKGTLGGTPAEIHITRQDLEDMAADYDPQLQEAPVTIEHSKAGPAHGWIAALRVVGDRLQARFKDLSESLRQWLRSGAYRSRSIEMYKPFEPTGKAYLGAVSFLGAAPPAVKGLSPVPSTFASRAQTDPIRVEYRSTQLREAPTTGECEMDEKTIAERVVCALKEMFTGITGNADENNTRNLETIESLRQKVAELEEALRKERQAKAASEARLAELEQELSAKEHQARLAEFTSALEQAAKEERITPAELKGYLSLGSRLDEEGRKVILEEVARRGRLSLFSELSAPGKKGSAQNILRKRSQFKDFPEDPEHDAALELMAKNPELSFGEAIKRVRMEAGL